MNKDERAALRALAEALPREEWHAPGVCEVHAPDHLLLADTNTIGLNPEFENRPWAEDEARARYIAAANPAALLALLDALDAAEAKRDAAIAELSATLDKAVQMSVGEAEAIARAGAAEADARRYRWIREIGNAQVNHAMHYADVELDAYIDAAIAVKGE